jgi:chromosome segregation ATPase
MDKPIELREACRRRMPLGGASAQALEGALSLVEEELEAAKLQIHELQAEVERSHKHIDELREGGRLLGQDIKALNLQIEVLTRALGDAVKVPSRMMATMDMPPMIKIDPLARGVLENAELHLKAIEEAALKQDKVWNCPKCGVSLSGPAVGSSRCVNGHEFYVPG